MAPDRNPLITRLGSNYTILETTQVVEKNGGQGRTDSRSESGARSDPSKARARIDAKSIRVHRTWFSVADFIYKKAP